MFSPFKKKTPPPGELRERKLAFISDNDEDYHQLQKSFESIGLKCDHFTSDHWEELVEHHLDFEVVMIDFSLGNGMMSVAISETLLRNAYKGRMFLLAHDSMEMYHEDYATVLMMDTVKREPMKVFNGKEITEATVVAETVFMKKAIANGRSK